MYKFITSWVHSLYKEILLFLIPQLYNLDNSFALISILYVVLYKKNKPYILHCYYQGRNYYEVTILD